MHLGTTNTTGEVEEEAMVSVEEETALSNKKLKGKNAKKGMAEVNGAPETCDVDAEDVSVFGKMKGKKGKKGLKIDDDEFDMSAFEERNAEPPQEAPQVESKFMAKNKGMKSKQDGDDNRIVQGDHQNGLEPVDTVPASMKNKEKLKGDLFSLLASYDGVLDGDEEETSVAEHADVDKAEELVFTGKKKKNSKGFKMGLESDPIVADDGHSSEILDDMVFTGKKKPKAKKGVKEKQEDEIGDIQTVESGEEAEVITFSGKKKGKKGKKDCQKKQDEDLEGSFPETGESDTLADDFNKALKEEDDDNAIVFSGKKKPKGRKSATFTSPTFDAFLAEEEEDVPQPEVAGKTGNKVQEFLEDGVIDLIQQENITTPDSEGASEDAIHFTGKKKGKKVQLKPAEDEAAFGPMSAADDSMTIADSQKQKGHEAAEELGPLSDAVGASKKQKKKKKKS